MGARSLPTLPGWGAGIRHLGSFFPLTSVSHTNETDRQVKSFPHHTGQPRAIPLVLQPSDRSGFPLLVVLNRSAHGILMDITTQ